MTEELLELFYEYPKNFSCYGDRIGNNQFESIINKILMKYNLVKGNLEAKVYTYEKIIANSNFAPILKEIKKKEGKDNVL